ncbi:MAG: hypothetical protein WCI73_05405 [Phycisphaerae bacterium]
MKRFFFNVLTVLWLLLCVAMAALWVWSYRQESRLWIARDWYESKIWTSRTLSMTSASGGILVGWDVAVVPESTVDWGEFPERTGECRFGHVAEKARG